jgi:hypothetical protein
MLFCTELVDERAGSGRSAGSWRVHEPGGGCEDLLVALIASGVYEKYILPAR